VTEPLVLFKHVVSMCANQCSVTWHVFGKCVFEPVFAIPKELGFGFLVRVRTTVRQLTFVIIVALTLKIRYKELVLILGCVFSPTTVR
jgi:hypothetical protein